MKVVSTAKSEARSKNNVKTFPGPKAIARDVTTEISGFSKIISMEMIDIIVHYTNKYIELIPDYERERDKKTTRTEILAVVGLLYLFGIKKANHTNVMEMWNTDGSGI